MNLTIKLRGDTEANWQAANPVLAEREVALSTDKLNFKVGNGVTTWASLGYWIDQKGILNILPALGGRLLFDASGKAADQEKDFWFGLEPNYPVLSIQKRTNGAFTITTFILEWDGNVSLGSSFPTSKLDINAGAISFAEMTPPSAPATDRVRLYAKDNGSGKTQLCVKFAGGSEIVLATQP